MEDLFEADDAVCWLGESLFPQLFDPEGPMSVEPTSCQGGKYVFEN